MAASCRKRTLSGLEQLYQEGPGDIQHIGRLLRCQFSFDCDYAEPLPMVAVGDVLTCLRIGCSIDNIGEHRLTNGERRLKSGAEMARLFHRHPAALRRTLEIADRCAFRLSDLRYQYPDEAQDGEPAQDRLERLPRAGLYWRYPSGPPPEIAHRVEKELSLIREVEYAPYLLSVHDIVQFARNEGILC